MKKPKGMSFEAYFKRHCAEAIYTSWSEDDADLIKTWMKQAWNDSRMEMVKYENKAKAKKKG